MKYCSKCKRLHNDEETVCKSCKAQLKTITDENTPVYLLTASGFELQRVKAALEDSTVPCDATIRKCVENRYNANAATGYDNSSYDVYVPFSAYEKAFDTCVGIGAIKLEGEEVLDDDTEYSENKGDTLDDKFEKMTGAKRTTFRVISAVIFLLLIALAVFGTDAIMNLIKGFFG